MATIIIAMFPEMGHLNATLKLARTLGERGHEIFYLGGSERRAYMEKQGMRFISLDEGWDSAGSGVSQLDVMEFLLEERLHCRPLNQYFTTVVEAFREGIEALISYLEPDFLLIDPYVPDVALIAQGLKMPFAFLNTNLFNPLDSTALLERSPELGQVPQLITCLEEFDYPEVVRRSRNRHFLGPGVDLQRKEEPFDWDKIDHTHPLIYCSLGSQSQNCVGAQRFFQVMIDAMSGLPHLQMILATGTHFNKDDFRGIPPNVLMLNYAPQLRILERADVVITHGGLNTIREALVFGVPLIVFPSFGEQPMNAGRVVHHGLGVWGNLQSVTVEQARSFIERVVETESFRERAAFFRERCEQLDGAGLAVKMIEALLAKENCEQEFVQ
jgi:UDP:flavonoid glycosyltransferase YjiC (YdhE family)